MITNFPKREDGVQKKPPESLLLAFFDMIADDVADSHGSKGSGLSRVVYTSKLFPEVVFKLEPPGEHFQNVMEWEYWNQVEYTPVAKWFAPALAISSCGRVLAMKRTKPARFYPDEMPMFLTDFKKSNYGMYKGRVVCHDYGTCLLPTYGTILRMKKVQWRDSYETKRS